jgi:plastocyanin
MRQFVLAGLLVASLTLAACGGGGTTGGSSGGSTIAMGSGVFSGSTSVTIKAGDAVTFDDSSGGPHQLVIGTHGAFTAAAGAPSQLNNANGVSFSGGDKQTIVFPNAGTFQITCLLHPSMQATVTVTQ